MTRGKNKCTSKGKQKQLQVSIVVIVVLYSCSCELYNVDFWGLLFDTPLVARCAPRLPASCPQDTLLWQAASRLRGSNTISPHNRLYTGLTPCAMFCRPFRAFVACSRLFIPACQYVNAVCRTARYRAYCRACHNCCVTKYGLCRCACRL